MRTRCLLASATLLLAVAWAYLRTPPNANTGRPGEVTCASCHEGESGSPDSTRLLGLPPDGYRPGTTYPLTLTVRYRGMSSWGFEITCADSANRPAGKFIITDSLKTQLGFSRGFSYVKQTGRGAYRGRADSCSWNFAWQAPDSNVGPVTFYWDALPCDNDGGPYGDVDIPACLTLLPWSPPAGSRRRFWQYEKPESSLVRIEYLGRPDLPLRIFNSEGRLVKACFPTVTDSLIIARWDGTDETGALVSAGDYFVLVGSEVDTIMEIRFVRRPR